jgi:hypothetical protein
MEDKERIEGTEEEVEAHRRAKTVPMAGEEPSDEAEEAEDVEAHALRNRPQAL